MGRVCATKLSVLSRVSGCQMPSSPSIEPDSQYFPSGVNPQADSGLPLAFNAVIVSPVATFQKRNWPSQPAVSTAVPSGVYAQANTSPSCRSPTINSSNSLSVPTQILPDGTPTPRALPQTRWEISAPLTKL